MNTVKKEFKSIATISELKEFLIMSGAKRRAFCHYTTLDGLQGMVKSGKLHLSAGKAMNDLLECETTDQEKWKRTYVISFTHTFVESIAMWSVYSAQLADD